MLALSRMLPAVRRSSEPCCCKRNAKRQMQVRADQWKFYSFKIHQSDYQVCAAPPPLCSQIALLPRRCTLCCLR